MNNYYNLKLLVTEGKELIKKLHFSSAISRRKSVLELFFNNENSNQKILIDLSQNKPMLVFDDRYEDPSKVTGINFFESLENEPVSDLCLSGDDRIVWLFIGERVLQITLFGPHANAVLLPESPDGPPEMFKSRSTLLVYPNSDEVEEREKRDFTLAKDVKAKLSLLNPKLPREFFPELIAHNQLEKLSNEELAKFIGRVTDQLESNPVPAITDDFRVGVLAPEFLPEGLCVIEPSIIPLIRKAYFLGRSVENFKQNVLRFERELVSDQKKFQKLISQVGDEDKILEKAEKFRQKADVLMAHLHLDNGEGRYEFENFYDADDSVTVDLERGKTLQETAQKWYKKSKHLEDSLVENQEKVSYSKTKLAHIQDALNSLSHVSESSSLRLWAKKYAHLISESKSAKSEEPSLPFRSFFWKNFEIWLGRNASSNDEVLRLSHKEDIWMHARGVGGSHLVIRNNRNREWPSPEILEGAASLAAYYSKSRGSKVVAVQVAKRKFVRKVKGGVPGMVLVDKERVIDVVPIKELK